MEAIVKELIVYVTITTVVAVVAIICFVKVYRKEMKKHDKSSNNNS